MRSDLCLGLLLTCAACSGGGGVQQRTQALSGGLTVLPVDWTWSRVVAPHDPITTAAEFNDWINTHPRLAGATTFDVGGLVQRPSTAAPDFNIPTTLAMNTASALLLNSTDPTKDRMFIVTSDSSLTPSVTSVGGIHTGTPVIEWSQAIDANVDGGGLFYDLTGSTVYTLSSAGTLYAMSTADVASPRVTWHASVGASVSWAGAWLTFDESPAGVYVADLSGKLTKFNASTGAQIAQVTVDPVSNAPIHSLPLAISGVVWVANDNGKLYRFTYGLVPIAAPTTLCAGACNATSDQVWSSPLFDSTNYQLYYGINNGIAQIRLDGSLAGCVQTGVGVLPCTVTTTTMPGSIHNTGIFTSSPSLDFTTNQNFVYGGFRGQLTRFPYTVSSSTPPVVTLGTGLNIPTHTAPTPFVGNFSLPKGTSGNFPGGPVYIGDGDGYFSQFQSTTSMYARLSATQTFSDTGSGVTVTGSSIDSFPVFDFGGGVYFSCAGTTSPASSNKGAWVGTPMAGGTPSPAVAVGGP